MRSVFARNGRRPLCKADERGHTISFTASRGIMRLQGCLMSEKRQIVVVLRNALRFHPERRARSPWKAFNTKSCLSTLPLINSSLTRRCVRGRQRLVSTWPCLIKQFLTPWSGIKCVLTRVDLLISGLFRIFLPAAALRETLRNLECAD